MWGLVIYLHDEICRIMIGGTFKAHAAQKGDETQGGSTVDRLRKSFLIFLANRPFRYPRKFSGKIPLSEESFRTLDVTGTDICDTRIDRKHFTTACCCHLHLSYLHPVFFFLLFHCFTWIVFCTIRLNMFTFCQAQPWTWSYANQFKLKLSFGFYPYKELPGRF